MPKAAQKNNKDNLDDLNIDDLEDALTGLDDLDGTLEGLDNFGLNHTSDLLDGLNTDDLDDTLEGLDFDTSISEKEEIEDKAAPKKTSPLFVRRQLDAEKQVSTHLIKDFNLFTSTKKSLANDRQFGGLTSLGEHQKMSKRKTNSSLYYLAPRKNALVEYLAYEVLAATKLLNTPKARFVEGTKTQMLIATKSIKDYMPIVCLFDDFFKSLPGELKANVILKNYHETYIIDLKRQLIVDKTNGNTFKISGNLFASDIGAALVNDADFFNPLNYGLAKVGNRFHAFFIDKDASAFTGESYQEIANFFSEKTQDSVFPYALPEQKLALVYAIQQAMSHQFASIFQNERVQHTLKKMGVNNSEIERLLANLTKTAASICQAFFPDSQKTILEDFLKREKIRKDIAQKVVSVIAYNASLEEQIALQETIIQDLCAPYYFDHPEKITETDLNNEVLINKIIEDQFKELAAQREIESNCRYDSPVLNSKFS